MGKETYELYLPAVVGPLPQEKQDECTCGGYVRGKQC